MIETNPQSEVKLELVRPAGHGTTNFCSAQIAELRELRGRVFYEGGQRPSFRRSDGAFDDPDRSDTDAFHVVARSDGRAAGCARVVPAVLEHGWIASVMGKHCIDAIARDLGADPDNVGESSRWVVAPESRGTLGPMIVAATWAVARWLRIEIGFVLACTCRKQNVALMRMGARPVPGLPLFSSPVSDDRLHLLYFDVARPVETMRKHIDRAATLLGIAESAVGTM